MSLGEPSPTPQPEALPDYSLFMGWVQQDVESQPLCQFQSAKQDEEDTKVPHSKGLHSSFGEPVHLLMGNTNS